MCIGCERSAENSTRVLNFSFTSLRLNGLKSHKIVHTEIDKRSPNAHLIKFMVLGNMGSVSETQPYTFFSQLFFPQVYETKLRRKVRVVRDKL